MSAPTPSFLADQGIRLLLFGGKGGVGKTSCATATALQLARDSPGAAFLLVLSVMLMWTQTENPFIYFQF